MKKLTRRKLLPFLLAGLALVVLVAIVFLAMKPKTKSTSEVFYPKATESPLASASPTPSASPSATPGQVPSSPGTVTSTSGAIIITSPAQGDTITSGTTVTGKAQVFEGTVSFRLKGSKSGQLAAGSFQVKGDSSQLTPYSFNLAFTNGVVGGSDTGVLEVFSISPKDGSEVNQATVAVNIKG